jgi:hypothetical protein
MSKKNNNKIIKKIYKAIDSLIDLQDLGLGTSEIDALISQLRSKISELDN